MHRPLSLSVFLLFFLITDASAADVAGAVGERAGLLQLKASVSDPAGILSRWTAASDHCSWHGVSCDAGGRVVAINISAAVGVPPDFCSLSLPFRTRCPGSGPRLAGKLSPAIGMLDDLRILSLPFHSFDGEMPGEIWSLKKLEVVDLEGCSLAGTLPSRFPHMLRVLNLASNLITGEIPHSLFLCMHLETLDLSFNRLEKSIPEEIGAGCSSLEILDLSGNFLVGSIPSSLGNCSQLQSLLLFSNRLDGVIPSDLFRLKKLRALDVSRNKLRWPVPEELGNFKELLISASHLHGRSMVSQTHIVNENQTEPLQQDKRGGGFSSIWVAMIASAAGIVSVLLALLVLYICSKKCVPSSSVQVQSSEIRAVTIFVDIGIPLTYESVVAATGNFNGSNCIGSGGFGATYKAEVSPGVLVAIKRLSVGRLQGVQQFHAEIKTLGRWRHPNLVTLLGYYGSDSEMFLIYNYLPGGNLERFLHERSKRDVEWRMLHKIASDVARAIAYLHDQCVPRILHRDVKPSNILLDNEFNAYLSDFGLARLLGNSQTHATTGVAGTFGYVAPEYAMTCRVSDKADVYSYGVVLLELLSDKKALDPSFSLYGDGFNIVAWASMLLHQGRVHEFFTEGLWHVAPHQQLIETLKLAITCTKEQLNQRPSMKQVVRMLKELYSPAS